MNTETVKIKNIYRYPWPLHRSVYENTNPKLYQESLTQEQPATTKKPSVSMRRSRVMSREDPSKAFRKIVKKPLLKSGDVEYEYVSKNFVPSIIDVNRSKSVKFRIGFYCQ